MALSGVLARMSLNPPRRDVHHGRSYQGQDRFVLEVLGGMRGGFFLDSGASNGLRGNNTFRLEAEFGWNGICIEPNSAMFRELRRNRRCICLDCCVYDREGDVDFLEAAGVYGGIVDEYPAGHLRFARGVAAERAGARATGPVVRKQALTIRSVLRATAAPRVIDYWSLDTEGSELAVLRGFPFDEYRLRVLTVEHNNEPAREDIRRFLEARGYARVKMLGIDDGYVRRDEWPEHRWRSRAWSAARRGKP